MDDDGEHVVQDDGVAHREPEAMSGGDGRLPRTGSTGGELVGCHVGWQVCWRFG